MEEYRTRYMGDDELAEEKKNNPILSAYLEERRWLIEYFEHGKWKFYGATTTQEAALARIAYLESPGPLSREGKHRKPEMQQGDRRESAGIGGHYDIVKKIGDVGGVEIERILTDPNNAPQPGETWDPDEPTHEVSPG